MNQQDKDWLEEAMLEIREETASPEVVSYLQQLLLSDPEARTLYLQYNQMDSLLESSASDNIVEFEPAENRRPYFIGGLIGAGIAAAITLIFALSISGFLDEDERFARYSADPDAPIATIASSLGANFTETSDRSNPRGFDSGEFGLEEGIAQLNFRNGAEVVLNGQCNFEIISDDHIVLHQGKLWAYCPPQAHGFKISVPGDKDVIDIGTEFAIEVNEAGAAQLQVFDGAVEIHTPDWPVVTLREDHALEWAKDEKPNSSKFADPIHFVTSDTIVQRRFENYQNSLLDREDLLAYYDFAEMETAQAQNLAFNSPTDSNAQLLGTLSTRGRNDDSQAIMFPLESSRGEINLQDSSPLQSFTTVMWIKADAFTGGHMSLINSDDWKINSTHFQIYRDGSLESSLFGGIVTRTKSHTVTLGQWHQVATTWDLSNKKVSIYCDGEQMKTWSSTRDEFPLWSLKEAHLGKMTLGHWDSVDHHNKTQRNFKGSIDEVLIFSRAFNADEIEALYQQGRP